MIPTERAIIERIKKYDQWLRDDFGIKVYAYDIANSTKYFLQILKATIANSYLDRINDLPFCYIDNYDYSSYLSHEETVYGLMNLLYERCELEYNYKLSFDTYPEEEPMVTNLVIEADDLLNLVGAKLKNCLIYTTKYYKIPPNVFLNIVDSYCLYDAYIRGKDEKYRVLFKFDTNT